MNFVSNIVSLVMFAIVGYIWLCAGGIMAIGQILGARLGSSLAVKKGARFIRPLYIVMVLATIIKMVIDRWL
jgi:uncharacterized membrane protein YfcA